MSTPTGPATIIGGPVSPYVRKVLTVCEIKGIPYRVDPIIPFFGGERFDDVSPLRRIPVYIDDKVSLCDSTVICEYLEERFPSPPVLPADVAQRANARWLEEFADTRIANVFVWKLFYMAVVAPLVWQQPRDKEKMGRVVAEELPGIMDYLERLAPPGGFLFGEVSLAEIAVAAHFANLRWARVEADRRRWPKTLAWVERISATPALARMNRLADRLTVTRPEEHRSVLAEMGMALTPDTVAVATPRRGPMTA